MSNISLNSRPNNLIEKVTIALCLLTLIVMGAQRSLADNLYNEYAGPGTSVSTSATAPAKKAKAPLKKLAKKARRPVRTVVRRTPPTIEQKRAHTVAKKRALHSSIDSEIQDLTNDLNQSRTQPPLKKPPMLIAQNDDASSTPPKRQGLSYLHVAGPQDTYAMAVPPTAAANTGLPVMPTDSSAATTVTQIETPKPDQPAPYSGSVDFTFGHDNNIDPDKTGMTSSYYAITPTLTLKSGGWTGSFTGTMQDYTIQTISDTNKSTEAHVTGSYEGNLADWAKSTTTIEGIYHNSMMPNDTTGPTVEGNDAGLSDLHYDVKGTEALDFKFNDTLSSQIGFTYMHREGESLGSDYASDILDPLYFTGSFNEYTAFGKVAVEAGSNVEFVLRPSIDSKVFTDRDARESDGSTGGITIPTPGNRDLLKSELAMDINFKFNGSTFGPTGMIGQVSDEVTGGENNSYYGGGVQGDIVLVPDWKLTLSPSLIYKHVAFDNWKYGVDWFDNANMTGTTRADDQVDVAIKAKMMFTKNFGWGMGYQNSHYTSNWTFNNAWNGANYNEEVYSTTATFTF